MNTFIEEKPTDPLDCPNDGQRMEEKVALPGGEGDYQPYIFQCPKCKNVEVLWR